MTGEIKGEGGGRTRVLYLGDHYDARGPYGFRMYRTTYGDDEKWNRFMTYFKANVEKFLGDSEEKDELPLMDWSVQSYPGLQDATTEQVREKFIQWVDSGEEQLENSARFRACIVVDEDAVESVIVTLGFLEKHEKPIDYEDTVGSGYVTLVSRDELDNDALVCIQNLYPTAYDFIHSLDWRFIEAKEGEISALVYHTLCSQILFTYWALKNLRKLQLSTALTSLQHQSFCVIFRESFSWNELRLKR